MYVGATGGIGKAIALAFSTQGPLDICLWSRSRDKLEAVARQTEQLGSRPHIVTGDLTKGEDCRRGVAEAVSQARIFSPVACQEGQTGSPIVSSGSADKAAVQGGL